MRIIAFLPILCLLILWSCKPALPDISQLNAFNENGQIQAVVEIPAGTHLKLEYDKENNEIRPDQNNGEDRVIDFLAYPANYGFVPGTIMNENSGGDGDPLDVFIIGKQLTSGTVLAIRPIGLLKVKDAGELDYKVIAVPVDAALNVIKVDKFSDFMTDYYMAQQIIQSWVIGYKGLGQTAFMGWEDEIAAQKMIEKWSKKAASQ